jgi:hypothetical protein
MGAGRGRWRSTARGGDGLFDRHVTDLIPKILVWGMNMLAIWSAWCRRRRPDLVFPLLSP